MPYREDIRAFLRRTAMLFKAFFTGIVDDISPSQKVVMIADWGKLSNKDAFIQFIGKKADARRTSMFETATRSNYLLVVSAFVIGGAIAMLVATDNPTSEALFKISIAMILASTAIFAIAIAAKSKVMKKPRKGGEIEPVELLAKAVKIQEATADTDANIEQQQRFFDGSNKLHKRKIILVVERRAQWLATNLMVGGLLFMIGGVLTF